MIYSMTAFARTEASGDWGSAAWELRSVNNRYLDVSTRLPEDLRTLEPPTRELIAGRLARGKLDCTLRYQPAPRQAAEFTLNRELVERLVDASREIQTLLGQPAPLSSIELMRWPGVVQSVPPDLEEISEVLLQLLNVGLDSLIAMRGREGDKLAGLIEQRCAAAQQVAIEVRESLPRIQEAMRQRVAARLAELTAQLDNDRVEQEMVLLANKMDVTEELDRLDAHIGEVSRVLGSGKPAGRRLDFLMQEMNREANTLGSKSVDATMTRASVDLKVLIDQMREQIQNIE